MNIKQVGYGPIILIIILIGLFIACAPKETKSRTQGSNSKFRQEYLGSVGSEKVYKIYVDSSEYVIIAGGNSSASIVRHK